MKKKLESEKQPEASAETQVLGRANIQQALDAGRKAAEEKETQPMETVYLAKADTNPRFMPPAPPPVPEPRPESSETILSMPLPILQPEERPASSETVLSMPLPILQAPESPTSSETTLSMPLPVLQPPERPACSETILSMPMPVLQAPERPVSAETVIAPISLLYEPKPKRSRSWLVWVAGGLVLLIAGGIGLYFLLRPQAQQETEAPPTYQQAPEPTAPVASAETIPEALKPYYEKAQKGDANAMRMLGVLYYRGWGVPMDRAKGIEWYRKAAAAGSKTAQEELGQMGDTR